MQLTLYFNCKNATKEVLIGFEKNYPKVEKEFNISDILKAKRKK